MIEVTRLNGMRMILNSDLIKTAEASPDTMLTLIHGEKLIVRESCDEVLEKVLAYRAKLLAGIATRAQGTSQLHRVASLSSLRPDVSGECTADEDARVDLARTGTVDRLGGVC